MARSRSRDTDTPETTTKPVNDAYVGMLAISLVALIGGSVLLYLDYSQYGESKPPKVNAFAPAAPIEAPPPPAVQPPPAQPPMDDKKDPDPKMDDKKDDVKD